jgi:nitroreductase
MAEIMDIIKKRISIRAYKDKPLPAETVKALLEAARLAPSARNLQQLEYKVITNKELINKMSDSISKVMEKQMPKMPNMPGRINFFYGAPLLVLITGPGENHWINSDAALAAQNIMLYATSINLGSCFIGMAKIIEQDKALLAELHITADQIIAAAVVCGYPDEKPAVKEKNLKAEYFK